MKNKNAIRVLILAGTVLVAGSVAGAAVKFTYEQGANLGALSIPISNTDLLNGLPAASILLNPDLAAGYPLNTNGYAPINNLPNPCTPAPVNSPNAGISGFHPAVGDPQVAKTRLVDGLAGANVDSVLTDFAWPAAVFQFDLPAATDIGEIRVFAANADVDGRVFQNYNVAVSTDPNPDTKERVFAPLINRVITSSVVCAGPGTGDGFSPNVNDGTQVPVIGATVTRVFDDANATLAAGVTSIRFTFWAVSNTQKVFRDQWVGRIGCESLLPTQVDPQDADGFARAFESSVIKEIDVLSARGPFEICDNGIDDDGDTLVDAADPDCFGTSCPPEICTDSIDNDGNTLVDCDDPDCWAAPVCNMEICNNTLDDDGDGLIDCADPDCATFFPDCVCSKPRFDADGDADVDQADFAVVQTCVTGPNPPEGTLAGMPIVCQCFDVTGSLGTPDQAVDQNDLGRFEQCASGPGIPLASITCDGVTP